MLAFGFEGKCLIERCDLESLDKRDIEPSAHILNCLFRKITVLRLNILLYGENPVTLAAVFLDYRIKLFLVDIHPSSYLTPHRVFKSSHSFMVLFCILSMYSSVRCLNLPCPLK